MRKAIQQRGHWGASLVEFALVLPMLFVLFINAVNFGGFFFAWITVANAGRAAGDYMVMGPASVNAPKAPTAPQLLANVVTPDTFSLVNKSTLAVQMCKYNPSGPGTSSATVTQTCTAVTGTFTTTPALPPQDASPEADHFEMDWVDVSYTYQPFIPLGFKFPGMGFGLTLPNNLVIHRQVIMRMLQ